MSSRRARRDMRCRFCGVPLDKVARRKGGDHFCAQCRALYQTVKEIVYRQRFPAAMRTMGELVRPNGPCSVLLAQPGDGSTWDGDG